MWRVAVHIAQPSPLPGPQMGWCTVHPDPTLRRSERPALLPSKETGKRTPWTYLTGWRTQVSARHFMGSEFSFSKAMDWCEIRALQSSVARKTCGDTDSTLRAQAPQMSWLSSWSHDGHVWRPPPNPLLVQILEISCLAPRHTSLYTAPFEKRWGGGNREEEGEERGERWGGMERKREKERGWKKNLKGLIPPLLLWTN